MKINYILIGSILGFLILNSTKVEAFLPMSEVRSENAFLSDDSDGQISLRDPRSYGSYVPRLNGKLGRVSLSHSGNSQTWLAQMDEFGAVQLWGQSLLSWDSSATLKEMDASIRSFVDENYAVFKVHSHELVLAKDRTQFSGPFRYVTYRRTFKGEGQPLRVNGAYLTLRFKFGNLIQITNFTFGEMSKVEAPVISANQAIAAVYEDSGFDETKDRMAGAISTSIQPFYMADGKIHFRYVYDLKIRKTFPSGLWNYSVGAESGAIVQLEPGFLSAGMVVADVYPRLPIDALKTVPLSEVMVTNGHEQELTQNDGTYAMEGSGATSLLSGARANVLMGGEEKIHASADDTGNIHYQASTNISENMAYVHVSRVNAFVRHFLKSAPMMVPDRNGNGETKTIDFLNSPITINTRSSSGSMTSCNAWYDPGTKELNFLEADEKCEASSQFADIIYHEWGHALDDALGGIQDPAFSEGIGDFNAYLMTQDHRLAPGFKKGAQNPIRDIAVLKIYPRDRSRDPHQESLIISGAWYEVAEAMKQHYGAAEGRMKIAELFYKHLVSTDSYMDSYMGALTVDDDDGNLDNCTPHMCYFNRAFSKRGLTSADPRCAAQLEEDATSGLTKCADSTLPLE